MDPSFSSSSSFPFAIRARLSTEDSESDSSISGENSGENSGRDESEEEDNVGYFGRPIARVTMDDEEDDESGNPNEGFLGREDGVIIDDVRDESERLDFVRSDLAVDESFCGIFFGRVEEYDDLGFNGSVIEVEERIDVELGNFKLLDERLVVEGSNLAVNEGFCGRVEENDDVCVNCSEIEVEEGIDVELGNSKLVDERLVLKGSNLAVNEGFCGKEEEDDDVGVNCSVIVVDDNVGLGLNDVEEDVDSGAVFNEEIEAIGCRDVELKDLVVELSTLDSQKNNLYEKIEGCQLLIPEVEDKAHEIVKVVAFGDVTSSKQWNEDAEEEIGVFEDKEEEDSGLIHSKIGFFGEKILEDSEDKANSTKLKLIHDNKVFEPEYAEVSGIYIEAEKNEDLCRIICSVDSEKPKHFIGEVLGSTDPLIVHENYSPSTDFSTETRMIYLDNVNEKNDESRVEEISIAENYSVGEFSSDNFSPFYVCEKEMGSKFDSFYFSFDEDSLEEDEHVIPEWPAIENSGFVKQILKEMEEDYYSSQTYILDDQTFSNFEQEGETFKDCDVKELFDDTCALASLLRASNGSSSGKVSIFTSKDNSSFNEMDDEEKMCSRLEQLRTKYLRLVAKLRHSPNDALPDHVLRQIGLIDLVLEGRTISEYFNLKTAKKVIFQHDEGKDDLVLSCTILVLGKTGVGKSAIINSIFGKERAFTDPFHPATTSVGEVSGLVDGVYIRLIDTPGLLTSLHDQKSNRNILSSIKKHIKRCPPDIILYVDRLDTYNRDFNELPMLRMITNILGSSIWLNAIIALTHANSAFPEGPEGCSMNYDDVVVQRSKIVQQLIRQAAGDSRVVNPVALAENHSCCRKDLDGESILPNGLKWRPWLLLLCYSAKIFSEVYSLMKIDVHSKQKLFSSHCCHLSSVFLSSNSSTYMGGDMNLDSLTETVIDRGDEDDRPMPSFKSPTRESRARKCGKNPF